MGEIAKQVVNFKARKGFSAAQSREHQRDWTEKGWKCALAHGNYDRSRDRLNFEISKGGKIQPIDKSVSIPKRMKSLLAARDIKDLNEGLEEPRFRTVVDFVLSGSKEKMREMAFGNQEVIFKPGNNTENSSLKRMPEIEHWARDMYTFVSGKYGEDNIIGFYVHLDETTPHIHCTIMPIQENRFAFKKMFAGNDKYEYKQKTTALHDEFAKVNEAWGLVRGTSITQTGARNRPTEEYRRYLDELCASKEEELTNLNKAITSLRVEITMAERRVKGLTTMVSNLEKEKTDKEVLVAELRQQIRSSEGGNAELSAKMKDLQIQLSSIESKLDDKKEKLSMADQKLNELNKEMSQIEKYTDELRQNTMQYSRDVQNDAITFIKGAMLENVVTDYQHKRSLMSVEESGFFKDTALESLSEFGVQIMRCATLLFMGYLDQASTFAEGSGGGGGGSDLEWGRDDNEDNQQWALRCLRMANKMMRPPAGKSRKR